LQIAISSGALKNSGNFPILASERIVSEPNGNGGGTTAAAIVIIIIIFIIIALIVVLAFFLGKKNKDNNKTYRNTWAAAYLYNKNSESDSDALNESLTGKNVSGSNVAYVDATDMLRKQQIAV